MAGWLAGCLFACVFVSQRFLSRSSVEIKIALETVEPVRGMVVLVDGWHGIGAHLNLYRVPAAQFLPVLAVKGHRRFGSCIVWNIATQDDVIWKHHGPKRQHVRTNGCQKNALFRKKKRIVRCKRIYQWVLYSQTTKEKDKQQQQALTGTAGCTTEEPAASE